MKLVVIIPALNEEATIGQVIRSIPDTILGISEMQTVVVDDGSEDRTAQCAIEAGAMVISHTRNEGVGAAFKSGVQRALEIDADVTVNIDADGQFSPGDIARLIRPIVNDEADFVTADRFTNEAGELRKPDNMPPLKYWGNKQVSRLISLLAGNTFHDVSCGFRAYSREALLHLNLIGRFTYTQESFLDLATKRLRIGAVPVDVKYFPGRKSRVADNLVQYALRTSRIIFGTYRDHKPLRFFGFLGAVLFALGLLLDGFVAWHYLTAGSFSPYKAVAFAGVYLNSLGILVWVVGLMADMLDRIRINQESIIYMLKQQSFNERSRPSEIAARERGRT